METTMFLTAKLNFISGMVIGAAAVLVMKQMCKRKRSSMPTDTPQE
jgi:predicted DNA repair protein MutK